MAEVRVYPRQPGPRTAVLSQGLPLLSHAVVSIGGKTPSSVSSTTCVSAAGRSSNFRKFADETSQPVLPSEVSSWPDQSTPSTVADTTSAMVGLWLPQLARSTMKWPRSFVSALVLVMAYRHVERSPSWEN